MTPGSGEPQTSNFEPRSLTLIVCRLHQWILPTLFFLDGMTEVDLQFVFIAEVSCQGIGCIDASVLSAGTAKIYSEAGESSFDVFFHSNIHNIKYAVQEIVHAGLAFKVFHHRSVAAMDLFKLVVPSWTVNTAAVKYKSSAIAAAVFRNAFAVREAADLYDQRRMLIRLNRCEALDHFVVDTK